MDKKTLRAVNDEIRFYDNALDQQLAIQLVGTFVLTVSFEASVDLQTWVACPVEPIAGGASVTSATGVGLFLAYPGAVGTPSLKGCAFRARVSAFTSGAVDVFLQPVRS